MCNDKDLVSAKPDGCSQRVWAMRLSRRKLEANASLFYPTQRIFLTGMEEGREKMICPEDKALKRALSFFPNHKTLGKDYNFLFVSFS